MGGWTLRNGRFIKSSYMVLNELRACQPTETKVQKKKKKKFHGYCYHPVNFISYGLAQVDHIEQFLI
jgi:hypothetical protein